MKEVEEKVRLERRKERGGERRASSREAGDESFQERQKVEI